MKYKRWLIYQLLRNANLRKGPTGEVKGKTSGAMRQQSIAKLITISQQRKNPLSPHKTPGTKQKLRASQLSSNHSARAMEFGFERIVAKIKILLFLGFEDQIADR